MIVVLLPTKESGKPRPTTLTKIEPHVIRQRALPICTLDGFKERINVDHRLSQFGACSALKNVELHGCQDIPAG
jgi:hypothetical protein